MEISHSPNDGIGNALFLFNAPWNTTWELGTKNQFRLDWFRVYAQKGEMCPQVNF